MALQAIEILYMIKKYIMNILKHANAQNITIVIYRDLSALVVQIIDDGIG